MTHGLVMTVNWINKNCIHYLVVVCPCCFLLLLLLLRKSLAFNLKGFSFWMPCGSPHPIYISVCVKHPIFSIFVLFIIINLHSVLAVVGNGLVGSLMLFCCWWCCWNLVNELVRNFLAIDSMGIVYGSCDAQRRTRFWWKITCKWAPSGAVLYWLYLVSMENCFRTWQQNWCNVTKLTKWIFPVNILIRKTETPQTIFDDEIFE